jgi:hypothetical protein
LTVAGRASFGDDVTASANLYVGSGKQVTFGSTLSDPAVDHNSASYRIDITTNLKVGGYLTVAGNDIRDSGGNTRIALATSLTKPTTLYSNLSVQGAIDMTGTLRYANLTSDPSGLAGMIYYNTNTNTLRLYNGNWVNISTGGAAGGGGVDGSGTVDTIPKFTGPATLGNSSITDDGTKVSIATDLRIQGNDIFFGASQTARKMYDDGATYSTRFSSNVYVDGYIMAKNDPIMVPLFTAGGGYTVNNPSGQDLTNCQAAFFVDDYFAVGTPLQVKMVLQETTSSDGNYQLKVIDTNGTEAYPIVNTDFTWDQGRSGWYMVTSSWKDWTPSSNNWTFSLFGWDSNTGNGNPVVSNCYVLVRAKR